MKRTEGFRRFPEIRIPTTRRFCLNCKRKTTFEYNPTIFHSECCVCGCRVATSFFPSKRNLYFKDFFNFCNIYEWSMEGKTEKGDNHE